MENRKYHLHCFTNLIDELCVQDSYYLIVGEKKNEASVSTPAEFMLEAHLSLCHSGFPSLSLENWQ